MNFKEFLQLSEEEYDYLRDKFGKNKLAGKQYSQNQIDSLKSGKRYRVGRVYYDVPYKDKDTAKALGMRWDKDIKSWYLNVYDKNLTWRTDNMFPKPKNLDKFFDPLNKKLGINFKVKDMDYYKAK